MHPFIALGLALRARGAVVVVACAAEYQMKVEAAGLVFRPIRPSFDDMQRSLGMDRAELTQALLVRSDFLFRRLIVPSVRSSYEDMLAVIDDADLMLTSSLAFGARLAAERRAVPWIGVVLQPLMFMSAFDPPVIPKAEWINVIFRLLGPTPTAGVLAVVKGAVGRLLGPVRALRREIGLAPTKRNPLFEGQFSSEGAIALYSSVMGDIRKDYPHPTSIVGFACFDSDDGAMARLDPALNEFLEAGPAPLVFTLGSVIVHSPGSFYRDSVAAARRLGKRAVLLVGETATAHAALGSADVFVGGYAPHSLLFPKAQAIAHQGGIGTLAQALRSGRPQLIVPFFADQLDNAARAVKLGVARSIRPARYTAASATAEIEALTGTLDYQLHAGEMRDRLAREDGASAAADIVLNRLNSDAVNAGVTR